ncbi:hypothetical protein MNBD_UNCLBAC01-19 [hydrothermal vent metagenome]|uniref:Nucleotidyltransferase family protein n=1 Tax=hydrothermal vent metagenome TaxID=652676 RepID=A0A3B1D161_9ZZZZ
MELHQDYKELLVLFNAHRVEYLIVGAYALAFYGAPRFTGDIDIFINPNKTNAKNIITALNNFGFGSLGLKEDDISKPNQVIQLGIPPVRIDLITSLTGLSWEIANQHKEAGNYDTIPVYFIGRQELIINKRSTNRKKDAADLEALGEE